MAGSYRTCDVDDCDGKHYGLGFCQRHYLRHRAHGDPLGGGTSPGEPARWLEEALLVETDECQLWPYGRDAYGYGAIWRDGKVQKVHRVVCELAHGPAPRESMDACHAPVICHEPSCFNPKHIRWDTREGNNIDRYTDGTMVQAKLTEDDVRAIRSDGRSSKDLESVYGVQAQTIDCIRGQKTWRWVE